MQTRAAIEFQLKMGLTPRKRYTPKSGYYYSRRCAHKKINKMKNKKDRVRQVRALRLLHSSELNVWGQIPKLIFHEEKHTLLFPLDRGNLKAGISAITAKNSRIKKNGYSNILENIGIF